MSFSSIIDFETALEKRTQPDDTAIAAAQARQGQLTKPAGSLGRLEQIALFLAGWQAREIPLLQRPHAIVFAGNHGVAAHGVSAFPTSVTAQMVANFQAGGAAINALSRAADMDLAVVAIELDRPTADFTTQPAMTEDECMVALSIGANAVPPDSDLLVLGEMGIANSTAAAALCARAFGGEATTWTGAGSGIGMEGVAHKARVVDKAIACHRDAPHSAFETLRRVGGREIAAISGAILRARQLRIPVMLDGFICCSALAPLAASVPDIASHCLASHQSAESGHGRLLKLLRLDPLLHLEMRLGEGSGAAVAVNIVRSALAAHAEMATFAQAGVSPAQ
ncbi:nicotinate-nucleotide--dimethylbenzimidazole phosphoribosyltransferase [Croceicoccus estronivorus]|uniref:nicotinate-nucleotide--dimethylbenzimidazole phosphoribosyltransferase n=1 Tax=Croceicoccus estronivorus TaxID=1172626 RepID=UPI00082B1279|nr:nicotinate-nucleotide--dimethylbenzimidazole phosphoribosyltransferase [Croceicoccus estronivorus]OCC24187.1 nicotinate-nucleotide--dimethylbenzimidazole phosphoribosyltransferase [Croceicoccus estronivorus]